jgi:hypothetical protein
MGIQHARLGAERLWKENQPLGYQALGPTVKRWPPCTISGPIARESFLLPQLVPGNCGTPCGDAL